MITPTNSDLSELNNHTLGTSVDISSYISTPYECPSDGYIRIESANSVGAYITARADNKAFMICRTAAPNQVSADSMFVRKGFTMLISMSTNGGSAEFYPLVYDLVVAQL